MTDSHRKWIAIATGVVALLAVGSQFLSGQALPPSPLVVTPVLPVLGATSVQPKITWSTTSINVILSPGESTSSNLTFTSSQSLTNVTLRVVPQIAPFLTVQPSSISSAPANQTQSVQLSLQPRPGLLGSVERLRITSAHRGGAVSSYRVYDADVETILICAMLHFERLNRDAGLTEADEKQLKDFYLQHLVAPKARKLLEEHFPEEFSKFASSSAASKTRP